MFNSVFLFILRNQQTAGCSSLTEFKNQRIAGPGYFNKS
jgi:hypothetical protein